MRRNPIVAWRAARITGVIASATMLATAVGGVPALAAQPNTKQPVPAAAYGQATPRKPAQAPQPDPAITAADALTAQRLAAGVHYPSGGAATVTLPAAGAGLVPAGSLPVRVGLGAPARPAPAATAEAGPAGASVTVTVASQPQAQAAGVDGMLISLSRTASQSSSAASSATLSGSASAATAVGPLTTSIELDYASMANAGGDFAERLILVELPACALTTPSLAACQRRTPVPFHNDLATHMLAAQVSLPAAATSAASMAGSAVAAGSGLVVVAATSGPASGGGDYTATSLSPSASWQAGGGSGDFSWSYPLQVPPANGGPAPNLAITYDSQSLDGRLPAVNNQPSWIGDGFDLPTSYIERSYDSCSDEGVSGSYDECWKYDNASLVLNGHATQLIRNDATGTWRPQDDDGSLVVDSSVSPSKNGDNDGETWTVTTTDGTKYVFGMNELPGWTSGDAVTNSVWTVPVYGNDAGEPCHAATFASSSCAQAWRWNLDYIVDPNGNTETFWYTPEYNYYAQDGNTGVNGTKYTRGGYLSRIDYGQASSTIFTTPAPEQVLFSVAERCIPTSGQTCTSLNSGDQADWPDVPFDAICPASSHCTAGQVAPTFFTTKRLTGITTQYHTGSGYQQVDSWALTQSFPATGDGTSPALWLDSIQHTGLVGGRLAENAVTFGGIQLTNRVDTSDDSVDPLIRWRIRTITSETGSVITVNYMQPQCVGGQQMPTPDANTSRCFPQYWTPPGDSNPVLDWFQKYPVAQVLQTDPTGGSPIVETDYTYTGAAWHYDDASGIGKTKYKTWSQWRGYQTVTTTTGAAGDVQTATKTLYFQGMDGDKLAAGGTKSVTITDSQGGQVADAEPLAGQQRETITYNGVGGPEVSGTIYDKFQYQTATQAESWGTVHATIVADAAVHTRTDLAAGGVRTQTVSTTYDTSTTPATGLPLTVDDTGDTAVNGDETCTRTTYAYNTSLWLMNYPDRVEKVAVPCADNPSRPADVISDTRTEYDGGSFGDAPIHGNATGTERLASYSEAGEPSYQSVSQTTYDSQGRPLSVADAKGNTTTTSYTPTTGGPLTGTTVTNALGQVTTTTINPAWGSAATLIDANGKRTDETYDPLGELVAVWQATRSKANGQNPNIKYVYTESNTAPSTVVTESLNKDGSTYLTTSVAFYDALLRPRQTQTPAPQGGRVITQTDYNSLGQAVNADADYTDATSPSTTMANVISTWPKQTRTGYDGAGRAVSTALYADGAVSQVTTTVYGGDRTTLIPPEGGVAETTITDIRGNVVERDDYNSSTAAGSYVTTHYTYTPAGNLASITDAAGNQWHYGYDLQGRQISSTDPDAGTSTTTYDDDDNVLTVTDATDNQLAYTYDALNRKTGEYLGSVDPADEQASWLYDTVAKGQLSSSTRYVGGAAGAAYVQAVTSYDALYRVTGTKLTIPASEPAGIAGTYSSTAAYNLDGTLQVQTIPAGGGLAVEPLVYTYNSTRQITKIQGSTGILQNALYTKLGQIQQTTLGVSPTAKWVQDTYSYQDGTGRLHTSLVTDDTNPTPDSDITYSYDPSGNPVQADDTGSGTVDDQCFSYGPQARLAEAWTTTSACTAGPSAGVLGGPAPYWLTWTYDPYTGLRTQQTDHTTGVTTSYTYPAAGTAQPHALQTTAIDGTTTGTYDYDVDGQTTSMPAPAGQQTLTWTPEGDLATITQAGQTTTNIYDAGGNLLISHGPSTTTLYVDGEQITRTNTTAAMSCQRELQLNGQTIAVRTNTGLTWLITDPHNTATLAINATTQTTTHRYTTPFNTPRSNPPSGWPDNNGFLDKPQDPTTALTYIGAREYDPATG